jgi:hypothetical protein
VNQSREGPLNSRELQDDCQDLAPACLYGQVIKTRRNDRIVKVERRAVIGDASRLEETLRNSEDSSKLNTSFVERLNLTIRQGSAYLFRRTLYHARWKNRSKSTSSYFAVTTILLHTTSPHYVFDNPKVNCLTSRPARVLRSCLVALMHSRAVG